MCLPLRLLLVSLLFSEESGMDTPSYFLTSPSLPPSLPFFLTPQVFNMGHRMELYVPSAEVAASLIAISEELGVDAQVIGRVEAAPEGVKRQVTITGPHGEFTYV